MIAGSPTERATSAGATAVTRLAVVGAGLVGGSICAAARRAGVEQVVVTDLDPLVRDRARELGVAHEVTDALAPAVTGADLVIVATPAATVPDVVTSVAELAPADAVLTDVASLKADLTLEIESRLRAIAGNPSRFVGGHPMAGSERSGPDAADATLFQGATWVVTPTATTDDAALHRLSGFLRRLGARVLVLPPQRHDELVAVVSHLPQVAASALADVAAGVAETAGEALLAVAGGGFRDTTRIAASDPELWIGILRGNRGAVLEALALYQSRVDAVRAALEAEDWEGLRAVLTRASEARRRLVPKEGEASVVDLVVALEDRPGALAAATTALGEAGVNIEDLAMRHAAAGDRGALLVRIEATATERAVAALAAHGLGVHVEDVDPGAGTHA